MREGLLWFDADARRSAQSKLDEALIRFRERCGVEADCCHVSPSEVFSHPTVQVVPDPAVLRHHFLVGCDEEASPPRQVRRRRSA